MKFDKDKCAHITISTQIQPVTLKISDDLDLYNETISSDFSKRISEFIGKADYWIPICIKKMAPEKIDDARLISIFILSEQDEQKFVLGLEFHTKSDEEHGRGFKIDGDDFSIIEYGLGDVAFA